MGYSDLEQIKEALKDACENIRHADVRVIIQNGYVTVEEYVSYSTN